MASCLKILLLAQYKFILRMSNRGLSTKLIKQCISGIGKPATDVPRMDACLRTRGMSFELNAVYVLRARIFQSNSRFEHYRIALPSLLASPTVDSVARFLKKTLGSMGSSLFTLGMA